MTLLRFPAPRPAERSLGGFLMGRMQVHFTEDENGIEIVERGEAVPRDVHHMLVRIKGDDRLLRVIVAPVGEPIEVLGRPVAAVFPEPEGVE